ncbi:MAG: SGNH/GDSL hydrolase family protein [Solirubrobacterales bacterium]
MNAIGFSRFVALGDSTTEGLDDPYPDGESFRGWADRLAARLALLNPDLRYANLAIRGRLIGQIFDTQLEPALAMRPDLASVVGGVNDILRPRVDMNHVRERMESMQRRLIEAGATVLSMTLPDLSSSMGVARLVSDRLLAYNELMREVAARTGAVLVDMADEPVAHDPRLWSADRLHANAQGHERISIAAAHALGLPDVDYAAAQTALPPPMRLPLYRSIPADVAWAWQHFRPWIGRRLRGRSSGDGVEPKRPELAPFDGPAQR